MPILNHSQFITSLKPDAKLLGLDISKTSIGIGFADVSTGIVTPVMVIKRARLKGDAAKLLKLIQEYGATGLVCGWPLHMDGSEGKRCQAVKDTASELLRNMPPIPLTFQDERLSTSQAYTQVEEMVCKSLNKRGKNAVKVVDNHAAMIILRSFLEALPAFRSA